MLDVVNRLCRKWRRTLNGEKSKVLHFRNKTSPRFVFNFKCGDIKIEFDSSYRYLGLNFNEFKDYKYTIGELTKSLCPLYERNCVLKAS